MQRSVSLLAALAAAACEPVPAVVPPGGDGGVFAGCSAVFTSVLGWAITCDSTTLVTREGDDVEGLLRGARESMRSAFAGAVEERHDDLQVDGATRRGLELSLRTSHKDLVAQGVAAVLEADAHPARMIACLAGADDASLALCRRQLDALGSLPYGDLPPRGVRIRPRPAPAIAERPIVAPEDCHLAANDRTGLLDCGDAALGWSEPSDPKAISSQKDATVDDLGRRMRVSSAQPPKTSSSACQLEGVATKCTVVKWPSATLTIGGAAVRGHTILAWCFRRDGSTSRVCDDTFTAAGSSASPRGR